MIDVGNWVGWLVGHEISPLQPSAGDLSEGDGSSETITVSMNGMV